jgi:phosphoglycolate phosphatase-like HAD superfamily hydrolase
MNRTEIEPIALFDMDGTLCDYERALKGSLEILKSPFEPTLPVSIREGPEYLKKRADLIRRGRSWWENLPKFKLG